MTLVPFAFFVVGEVTLRTIGYGYPTEFFLDGTQAEKRGTYIENRDFGRWVFPAGIHSTPAPPPLVFPAVKRTGTCRIFVVGESAAMGFPDSSSSFSRVLEVMLKDGYPDTRFEVINVSMVAINSHVVLPIARQCLQHKPDLLIVHVGNNEVVGPFGAAGVLGPYAASRAMIKAHLSAMTMRSGQLLHRLTRKISSGERGRCWDGMATFAHSHVGADDPRLPRVYDHFSYNLQEICRLSHRAGVPVVLCTIPVNLKDCPPFHSAHRDDLGQEKLDAWDKVFQEGVGLEAAGQFAEALARYQEAAHLDDAYAELHYRLGRCCSALGKTSEAKDSFRRARDFDTLRFRADTAINDTIRGVAAARAADGVHLTNAESVFDAASPSGIAGDELFLEHVHMNFEGNYLLARSVLHTIQELAPPALGAPRAGKLHAPAKQQCADMLAFTDCNEFRNAGMVREGLIQAPFTGQLDQPERVRRWDEKMEALKERIRLQGIAKQIAVYEQALARSEGDWMIRMNFGLLLLESGDLGRAAEEFRAVQRRLRHGLAACGSLGDVLLKAGRVEEAAAQYTEALRLNPDSVKAHIGLGSTYAVKGKFQEAIAYFERRLEVEPDRVMLLMALGECLAQAGQPEAAKARLQEALDLKPNQGLAHLLLGDLAATQGATDEALAHYQAAQRLGAASKDVSDRLARLRKQAGQRDTTRRR